MQPQRRSYSKSFKVQVIQECAQPGASIASVALSHSLNANLVHKWIRVQMQKNTELQPAFIPLPMQLQMLTPGAKKTHRAYVWAYATSQFSDLAAVVYDFSPSRAGEHARNFLQDWKGKLVCDDFGGYKASFELGVTEIGCMAHARRKFFELHATNKSQLAEQALRYIQLLYEIEREVRDLEPDLRRRIRQEKAVPVMDALHAWMIAQRQIVHDGSAISKALDYSLKRWTALSRYLDDGAVPIDNNWAENQIRPWALGRKNWLFAGSLRSGKRAAAIMSLIQSARLNGHDPYAYLKDVLTRLPTQRASEIAELLPHRWQPV